MPGVDTLVKYDNAVLISTQGPKKKEKLAGVAGPQTAGKPVARAGARLPPVEAKPQLTQTEDILNQILPPKEHNEDGQLWVQRVSCSPATRQDVLTLQEELDKKLKTRQARETGICPIRQELYAQCFDEIIRQVTVNCNERGLLLHRVRDELRMTLAAYQTLYESSIAFGMRKALQAEQGKAELEAKIQQLEAERNDYKKQVEEHKAKNEALEKRFQEQTQQEQRKHQEEVNFLKRTNAQLKTQLESLLAPSGKK